MAALLTGCGTGTKPDVPLSVMSFNIRYANVHDGEHAWIHRKEAVIRMLEELSPAIIGIQEGLYEQVLYLDSALFGYSYTGVGRDDGSTGGEYAAIFFDAQRFEEIASGNFWLSETPDRPSVGWDAVCVRIATWVKLRDRETGRSLACINTHFDHVGTTARMRSAQMLADSIASIGADMPVVVTGDFNSTPADPALRSLAGNPALAEARETTGSAGKEPDYTYIGFEGKPEPGSVIDHIFVEDFDVTGYTIVTDSYGVPQLSDHYPVLAEIKYR